MPHPDDKSRPAGLSIDRRGFVAAGAGAGAGALATSPVKAQTSRHSHDDHNHAHDHSHVPSDAALTAMALESVLIGKGIIDPAALAALVEHYGRDVGPHIGAKVVARAWTDPEFCAELLENGTDALWSMGIGGVLTSMIKIVANSPTDHHLVVCTLCSCYPWPVLGLPPSWYKSPEYRSRVAVDPRGVLKEFGIELSDDVKVHVWDSIADQRYMVLPERPAGTEGWSIEQLETIVTRNAMIGTEILAPQSGTAPEVQA
nr:nitrile hydratase subunit alpha [Croceicoccus mobilis]